MSEPWLSDLSEDWKTPSSGAGSVPASSSSLPTRKHSSTSSRLPRPATRKSALGVDPSSPTSLNSPFGKQRVLSERSRSDINISSPMRPPSVEASKRSIVQHSTLSSTGSVVKRASPTHKSSNTSQRQKPKTPLPEWKQYMQDPQKGQLAGPDLFAKNSLEHVFNKPPTPASSESKLPAVLDSTWTPELSAMPSSPPTWPSEHLSSKLPVESNLQDDKFNALDIVHEELSEVEQDHQDNYKHHAPDPMSDQHEGSVPDNKRIVDSLEISSITPLPAHSLPFPNSDINDLRPPNSPIEQPLPQISNGTSDQRTKSALAYNQGSSSTGTDGFSPVFISKHNTADGGIDYAAVDVSNPVLMRQLQQSQSFYDTDRGLSRPEEPLTRSAMANRLHSSITSQKNLQSQWKSTSLAPISEFVNLERGTIPEHDSFMNRPLSPSATSSILPSESASQSHEYESRKASSADSIETAIHRSSSRLPGPTVNGFMEVSYDVLQANQVEHDEKARQVRMQAITGKRKDARYDDRHELCDPDELAKREILRPRNPTPLSQRLQRYASCVSDLSVGDSSTLELVQKQLDEAEIDIDEADEAELKALAGEVANRQLQEIEDENGNFRKPSVSTQDYLNDAMKIMEFIRAKRQPQGDLSNLGESTLDGLNEQQPLDSRSTALGTISQDISRPPSREGVVSAWRTENSFPINAVIASQLEKYQETGDESFVATSAFEDSLADDSSEHVALDEQSVGIRVRNHYQQQDGGNNGARTDETVDVLTKYSEDDIAALKTQSSNRSTDSSGQTQRTTSTQKTRTLAIIGPDKVSHLLHAEEAGMRFDQERNSWVKCRTSNSNLDGVDKPKDSDGTDEDPFENIPDLSTNEGGEEYQHPTKSDLKYPQQEENEFFCPEDGEMEIQDELIAAVNETGNSDQDDGIQEHSSTAPEIIDPDSDQSFYDDNSFAAVDQISIPRRQNLFSEREAPKRREVSVYFSSPPVSKHYEAQSWSVSNSQPDSSPLREANLELKKRDFSTRSSSLVPGLLSNSISATRDTGLNGPERGLSMSRMDQHHEVSFVGTRPDGRTMSLTLSISTPLPAHRSTLRPSLQGVKRRSSSLWNSLSPLSDFTIHQDDTRHLKARQLSLEANKPVSSSSTARPAVLVDTLVQKLTDVEPDEPYWDFMRALHLIGKDLSSLHMLEEFCPRIEELDVSRNKLEELAGIPVNVRDLVAKGNQLNSLFRWDHLSNLQYLDISSNSIERLDGFSSLVHLREVKADDNLIFDLEGIFDLDGLLHISLKRNRLQSLQFQGTGLKRLSIIDVEDNEIQEVNGLQFLPELRKINLNRNRLVTFPSLGCNTTNCLQLNSLQLANNQLENLDLKCFPNLQELDADENLLVNIQNISRSTALRSLSIRSQRIPSNHQMSIVDQFDDFNEIQHLYLSGNVVSELRSKARFLNLQTLEFAFTGLNVLPADFGTRAPNLRTLNLNSNVLTSLKPLRGIQKLETLLVASNRLSRLRKAAKVISSLPSLSEIDLRDNFLTHGFYPSTLSSVPKDSQELVPAEFEHDTNVENRNQNLKHTLPSLKSYGLDVDTDKHHLERLDEDTQLRKRLYELLLAVKAPMLDKLDGREFYREDVFVKDRTWNRLMELGIVETADDSE